MYITKYPARGFLDSFIIANSDSRFYKVVMLLQFVEITRINTFSVVRRGVIFVHINDDASCREFKRAKLSCPILAAYPQEWDGPKGRGSRGIPLADVQLAEH
jgi:hypothetical protein